MTCVAALFWRLTLPPVPGIAGNGDFGKLLFDMPLLTLVWLLLAPPSLLLRPLRALRF